MARLLILSILFVYTAILSASDKINLSESITTKHLSFDIIEDQGSSTYIINSDKIQRCTLSFWTLPAYYIEGRYSTYSIIVNGNRMEDVISFRQSGWQQVHTESNNILLNKGENRVVFISNGRDIPQIRDIKINSRVNLNNTPLKINTPNPFSLADSSYALHPFYRPGVKINVLYNYTFYIPVFFKAGETASFYAPTKSDPAFGIYESSTDFQLYFFHENPNLFSDSYSSNNKYLYQSVNIEHTGVYYVLVEAKLKDQTTIVNPFVSLRINSMLYRYNPVSSTNLEVLKENLDQNVVVSSRDSCYNIFTVNPRTSSSYIDKADPCLWLKKRIGIKEIVVAYNDDNKIYSDCDWGKNARIRTYLDDNAEYNVFLSSANPIYSDNELCDVYHSFWNNLVREPDDLFEHFPNLKYEDAIESDNNDYTLTGHGYNCYAWTGGINAMDVYPSEKDENYAWFDAYYNNEEVQCVYMRFSRPGYSLKYTREGVTDDNAIVDIWGTIDSINNMKILHGSIRNYASDGIPHGYAWESKIGVAYPRIFHPRYALSANKTTPGYGKVLFSYRIADDQVRNLSSEVSMAASIADNVWRIENIYLTDEEIALLDFEVNKISTLKTDEFNRRYNQWKDYAKKYLYGSSLLCFRECDEYRSLLGYVKKILKQLI